MLTTERERLKTLFLPFRDGWFGGYYRRFEQRAQSLSTQAIEEALSVPTYAHRMRNMFVKSGIGLALIYGGTKLILEPTAEFTSLHYIYLFSLGPQALMVSLLGPARDGMIQTEQSILQKELASR